MHLWKVVWWSYNKISVSNINFYRWLCPLLCSMVAFFSSLYKTKLGGSNSWHEIPRIVRMLERVPSSRKLGRIFILFLLTRLKHILQLHSSVVESEQGSPLALASLAHCTCTLPLLCALLLAPSLLAALGNGGRSSLSDIEIKRM